MAPFEITPYRLATAKYCSRSCMGIHKSMLKHGIIQKLPEAKTITWSKHLAYVIGIIATDGTLRKNRNSVKVGVKDKDVIEFVRKVIMEEVTGRENAINTEIRIIGNRKYIIYSYSFTSQLFYDFCLDIGLMPNKSLCLGKMNIPKNIFPHYLLGVIDGDGNFNTLRRKREGKDSLYNYVRIFSGSEKFLLWLNSQVSCAFQVNSGSIFKDEKGRKNPKFTLSWGNEQTVQMILNGIYHEGFYVMRRKFEQIKHLL